MDTNEPAFLGGKNAPKERRDHAAETDTTAPTMAPNYIQGPAIPKAFSSDEDLGPRETRLIRGMNSSPALMRAGTRGSGSTPRAPLCPTKA